MPENMNNENNQVARPMHAMAEVRPMVAAHEARVNVTWKGENGDLPDPVPFDATDGDIKQWVTEAVRGGGIPGIPADRTADFTDFVVDRFRSNEATPYNRLMMRPKTPFGTRLYPVGSKENRDWLGGWVDRISKDSGRELNPAARERAIDVAESVFHGNTGVGVAAEAGVKAVEREIYKDSGRR